MWPMRVPPYCPSLDPDARSGRTTHSPKARTPSPQLELQDLSLSSIGAISHITRERRDKSGRKAAVGWETKSVGWPPSRKTGRPPAWPNTPAHTYATRTGLFGATKTRSRQTLHRRPPAERIHRDKRRGSPPREDW